MKEEKDNKDKEDLKKKVGWKMFMKRQLLL